MLAAHLLFSIAQSFPFTLTQAVATELAMPVPLEVLPVIVPAVVPSAVGRANVNSFAEELLVQTGVADDDVADGVVAAERPEVGMIGPGWSSDAPRYTMAKPMVTGVSTMCSTLNWQMNGWCQSQPLHIAVK